SLFAFCAHQMAAGELRRSTRARMQVKFYKHEQAEQAADSAPRKRKQLNTLRIDDSEDEDEADVVVHSADSSDERPTKEQRKQSSKKSSKKSTAKATWHAEVAEKRIAARLNDIDKLQQGEKEHRLLDYVEDEDDLTEKYLSALKKVDKEKMFVLDRVREVHNDCYTNIEDCPCETLSVAGSKGNVYTVTISHLMTCNCPVSIWQKKGEESVCKHIIYVLHKILKAPEHLKYQQALLTRELKELFAHAPRLPSEIAEETVKDGNRKEATGECPICFEGFEESDDLTWCRAACGNNLHVACFQQWERAKNPVT
ncbi:uncharacterized protein MYCFIDRAFT_82850, partial [Pseudocercospora fijiensis CIRAD86]